MNSSEAALSTIRKVTLVLGCGLGMYFSIGIILIYSFSVFIKPIADDTGWNRSYVAAAVAPIALICGMMSPFVGAFTDKYGPRMVLIVSSITMAAGLAAIGITSRTLSAFVIAVMAGSLLGSAQTGVPYTQVLVGWFHARRGLALGVALSFVGLGIATIPPAFAKIISALGWRWAFVVASFVPLALTLPIALFVIRNPPEQRNRTSQNLTGPTLNEAVGTSSFWLMFGAFLFNYFAAAAGSISLPVILADRGSSQSSAALVMSVVGIALTSSRLIFGYLVDRLPAIPLTSVTFLAPVFGHLLLARTHGVFPVYVSAVFFGVGSGAEGDAMGYLLARRFGSRSFGKIYGLNYLALTVGTGLGPALLNLIAGNGKHYVAAFLTLSVIGMFSPLLLSLEARWSQVLPPGRRPVAGITTSPSP